MAITAKRTLKAARKDGAEITETLLDQIAILRKEIAEISDAVNDYSGHTIHDVQRSAAALAQEVRQHGAVALREANKHAHIATRVVRDNPVPAIAIVGTIALLSALLLARD